MTAAAALRRVLRILNSCVYVALRLLAVAAFWVLLLRDGNFWLAVLGWLVPRAVVFGVYQVQYRLDGLDSYVRLGGVGTPRPVRVIGMSSQLQSAMAKAAESHDLGRFERLHQRRRALPRLVLWAVAAGAVALVAAGWLVVAAVVVPAVVLGLLVYREFAKLPPGEHRWTAVHERGLVMENYGTAVTARWDQVSGFEVASTGEAAVTVRASGTPITLLIKDKRAVRRLARHLDLPMP